MREADLSRPLPRIKSGVGAFNAQKGPLDLFAGPAVRRHSPSRRLEHTRQAVELLDDRAGGGGAGFFLDGQHGVEFLDAEVEAERAFDEGQEFLGQLFSAGQGIAAADVAQADAVLFLAGFVMGHFARGDGPLQQQPGGELHQPGGEAHALGGVGDGAVTVESAGVLAAGAVEIIGGFLDQAHAFLEDLVELLGGGEPGEEIHHGAVRGDV